MSFELFLEYTHKKNVMTFDARLRHRLLRIYTHTSFVIEDFKYYKSMKRLAIYTKTCPASVF